MASYILQTNTRLNTEDYTMWQAAGLQVNKDGTIYETTPRDIDNLDWNSSPAESLVSHTLVWIILRVVNYLVKCKESNDIGSPRLLWETLHQYVSSSQISEQSNLTITG